MRELVTLAQLGEPDRGRRPVYLDLVSPGSPDLDKISDALRQLAQVPCPDLPVKLLEHRIDGFVEEPASTLLSGNHLLHTDLRPDNVLIADTARFIDWAWVTRGPAWADIGFLMISSSTTATHPGKPRPGPTSSRPGAPPPAKPSTRSPRPTPACGNRSHTRTRSHGNNTSPPPPTNGPGADGRPSRPNANGIVCGSGSAAPRPSKSSAGTAQDDQFFVLSRLRLAQAAVFVL